MAVITFLTRALPFLLFDRKGNPPGWCSIWDGYSRRPSSHAHRLLPARHQPLRTGELLPPLLAVLLVVGLHRWKHNT